MKTKLPRIVSVTDVDDIYVACEPGWSSSQVIDWLLSLDPEEVLEASGRDDYIDDGWSLVFRSAGENLSGYFRWTPAQEYDEYSRYIWPCNGPARGAFFAHVIRVEHVEEALEVKG